MTMDLKSWMNDFNELMPYFCVFFSFLSVSAICTQVLLHKPKNSEIMNNFSNEEFEFTFLDEGFTAKDILDQKINEVSSSVSMIAKWLRFTVLSSNADLQAYPVTHRL